MPVELRYETIVLEDGKLHIYKDVYAQDTNTEENLRSVLEAHGVKFEDLSEQRSAPQMSQSTPRCSKLADKTARRNQQEQNEVVIDLSTLAQKGYPAPVNLDTGSGKPVDRTKRGSNNRIRKCKNVAIRDFFRVQSVARSAPASP